MVSQFGTKNRPRIYYGWYIVIIVGLAGFTQTAEAAVVLSVFLKPVTLEFGWSRTAFTGAITIGTLMGGIIAIFIGPLMDRFGPKWCLIASFSFIGVVLILMAGITNIWQFYILHIPARSFQMGIIALGLTTIIPKWFIAKRGRAVAFTSLGSKIGNAVTPLYVQSLLSLAGWRIAFAATGLVMLIVLPTAMFLKRRPEDIGLYPDGIPAKANPGTDISQDDVISQPRNKVEISLSLKEVIRLPSFYLLLTASVTSFIVQAILFLHTIPYLSDKGLTPVIAVTVAALLGGAGAISGLVFGILVERYSVRIILAISFIMIAISFPLLLSATTPSIAIIWGIYTGLMLGGWDILWQVVWADYYGRESLGAIRGVMAPVQMMAIAIGPLAASLVFDITGSYNTIFTIVTVLTLISSIFILCAKPPNSRKG